MVSKIKNEILKAIVDKFQTNGHSAECSYLIVKYFIGLKENKLIAYHQQTSTSECSVYSYKEK